MKSIGKKAPASSKKMKPAKNAVASSKKTNLAEKAVASSKKLAAKAVEAEVEALATDAEHLELERKYKISEKESRSLETKLERHGFKWDLTSVITDTLLPAPSGETHRIRRQQILDGAKPVVIFYDTRKLHPVMPDGQHVRQEREETISEKTAGERIAAAIHDACSALPLYSKTRRTYVGKYEGYSVKVEIDSAQGLCRYSGYYMEIEILLPLGKIKKAKKVQKLIERLAQSLLGDSRRAVMSYRKMLLASIAGPSVVQ